MNAIFSQNTQTFEGRAQAKCNLSLAVTGKRGDLHTLDMILAPLPQFEDTATFCPLPNEGEYHISLVGAEATFDGFLQDRFAFFFENKLNAIAKYFHLSGEVYIKKGVPLGAGLGGSSCCVAATVKAVQNCLAAQGRAKNASVDFLLSLGSDVPAVYEGGLCRVTGVGENVNHMPKTKLPKLKVFIAEGGSDSAACYRLFDKLNAKYPSSPPPTTTQEALAVLRNDLSLAAETLNPNIKALRERLLSEGMKVVMSGSGSALIAFE